MFNNTQSAEELKLKAEITYLQQDVRWLGSRITQAQVAIAAILAYFNLETIEMPAHVTARKKGA